MKLRANRINLKLHARALLGNEYSPEKEKALIACAIKPLNLVAGIHPSHTRAKHLAELGKILGTYGVEGMLLDKHGNDCAGNCSMHGVALDCQYCNAGDTYAITLMYVGRKLYIGDWGSLVEALK